MNAVPLRMDTTRLAGPLVRQQLGLLAKLFILAATLLVIAGILWHGVSLENVLRIWRNVIGRPSASFAFRFILQPAIAVATGIIDGRKDARMGRLPFLRGVLTEPAARMQRLREGVNSTARILLLGIGIDIVYQLIEFQSFYPIESLLMALLLAFLPYCIIRGMVVRAWSRPGAVRPSERGPRHG